MRALITVESNVSDSVLRVATAGLGLLGRQLQNLGGLKIDTLRLGASQNFLGHRHNNLKQVDDSFIRGLEHWANKSLNLYVTARPLSADKFGDSIFGGGIAVVSGTNKWPRELAAITIHESVHAFGLVNPDSARAEAGHHCGNLCIMHAIDDLSQAELLNNAAQHPGLNGSTAGLCGDCRSDLHNAYVVFE